MTDCGPSILGAVVFTFVMTCVAVGGFIFRMLGGRR
jgi:hypothetical protein